MEKDHLTHLSLLTQKKKEKRKKVHTFARFWQDPDSRSMAIPLTTARKSFSQRIQEISNSQKKELSGQHPLTHGRSRENRKLYLGEYDSICTGILASKLLNNLLK